MKSILLKLFFVMALGLPLRELQAATPFTGQSVAAINAKEIISDIMSVVGLQQNFSIMEMPSIPNAAAMIYRGQRVIAYNPNFVSNLNAVAGNKWAAVSVLAHEVGHHLNGHTLLNTGSQPPLELESDEFSGFVLKKMGASLSQAQAAMKIAAQYKQSHTHPAQADRLVAIAKGWNKGAALPNDMAKYNLPEPKVSRDQPIAASPRAGSGNRTMPATGIRTGAANRPVAINSNAILARVDFPSDRSGSYFITTRYNVVKVQNNEVYLLGKMLRTNSAEYPYVLRNVASKDLFVHQSGKIFTARKELAGVVKMNG
jgi:hypothetical protein